MKSAKWAVRLSVHPCGGSALNSNVTVDVEGAGIKAEFETTMTVNLTEEEVQEVPDHLEAVMRALAGDQFDMLRDQLNKLIE